MSFIIRSAKPDDVELILTFIRALAKFERLEEEVLATPSALTQTLFNGNPSAHVIIGEFEAKPVAFALYFFNYSTFLARQGLYLEDLYVLPEYRSHGFGYRMLAHLAAIAKEKNCGRMEWSALDWNQKAIAFYKRLGARPMEEWTTFRVSGEVLLKLAEASFNP